MIFSSVNGVPMLHGTLNMSWICARCGLANPHPTSVHGPLSLDWQIQRKLVAYLRPTALTYHPQQRSNRAPAAQWAAGAAVNKQ